jgi:hypothetical protein
MEDGYAIILPGQYEEYATVLNCTGEEFVIKKEWIEYPEQQVQ